MRRASFCAVLLVMATSISGAAAASLPPEGRLVPGRSLGGLRLGETAKQVRAQLGRRYGVCRGCATTTWYFTYRPFTRSGLAVELRRGRVSALWTIWQPRGWRTPKGLRLGALQEQVNALAGPLVPLVCSGYDALTRDSGSVRTAYYVVDGKLWGFGLLRRSANPCR
jgi:hypothetical protein